MPVPPLPDPPVGRFPPEHPIWPPPQKEALPVAEKKRVGMNPFQGYNPQMMAASNQVLFPQASNNNQKYSEADPSPYAGAYQQLMNVLENRNSKNNPTKQNRISSNLVAEPLSASSVYSAYNIEPDPKVVNDSVRLQQLYSEAVPTERHDTIDIINKLYNQQNYNKQLVREYNNNNIKKMSVPEVKDKAVNYTTAAIEPIGTRKSRP